MPRPPHSERSRFPAEPSHGRFSRDLYGFFPHRRLGLLPGVASYWGGFPRPGVFMIHRGNLGEDFVRFITAHEIGRYYWGLHVLDAGERLGWLMLANGIIADQLYLARHHGRTLEEQWRLRGQGDWMQDFLQTHLAGWEQTLDLDRTEAESLHLDYTTLIRHGRGATRLYLRVRQLGVGRFVEFQRALLRDFAHRPLDLETFVARLEAVGAADAGRFFDQWTRHDASIGWRLAAVDTAQGGSGRLFTFHRTGTVDYPVEVRLETGPGMTRRAVLGPGPESNTLHLPLEGELRVRLDPDGALPMWNSHHPGIRRLFVHAGWLSAGFGLYPTRESYEVSAVEGLYSPSPPHHEWVPAPGLTFGGGLRFPLAERWSMDLGGHADLVMGVGSDDWLPLLRVGVGLQRDPPLHP